MTQLRGEERQGSSPGAVQPGRRSGDGDRDLARRPSGSVSTASDSTNATNAQREMIIPNKSTIAEEDIEVPYGRERESSSTAMGGLASRSPRERDRSSPEQLGDTDGDGPTDNEPSAFRSPMVENDGLLGLGGLSARLRERVGEDDDEDDEGWSGQNRSGEEYFDRLSLGRASVTSDRSVGPSTRMSGSVNAGRTSKSAGSYEPDIETLRREYEYKIATMQTRITNFERSLEESQEKERHIAEACGSEKVRELEQIISTLNKVISCPLQ